MGLFSNKRTEELEEQLEKCKRIILTKNNDINTLTQELTRLQMNIEVEKDSAATLRKQIEILNDEIKKKEDIISSLNANIQDLKSKTLSSKQMEVVEKNLKDNKEKISTMKSILEHYGIQHDRQEMFIYKVSVDDFFAGTKYKEIISGLEASGIQFVQDIKNEVFDTTLSNCKNVSEAKKKFDFFLEHKMSSEVSLLLNRGEKISKVYSKSRKFTSFANENYLEFMDDLTGFDFECLYDAGFTKGTILELKDKRDTYYEQMRIQ